MSTVPEQCGGSREFLDRFPQRNRSWVANLFLGAVRDGITDPYDVLAVVADRVQEDMRRSARWPSEWSTERIARGRRLLDALRTADARPYAVWCVEYDRLPRAARDALRAAEGHLHRTAWMAEQPPTERQMAYLRRLGYGGPDPASKLDASDLIDRLLRQAAR